MAETDKTTNDENIPNAENGTDTQISDSKILNQEEIDSLLGYSNEEESFTAQRTGVRAILNANSTSFERLPMLEIVFCRCWKLSLTV